MGTDSDTDNSELGLEDVLSVASACNTIINHQLLQGTPSILVAVGKVLTDIGAPFAFSADSVSHLLGAGSGVTSLTLWTAPINELLAGSGQGVRPCELLEWFLHLEELNELFVSSGTFSGPLVAKSVSVELTHCLRKLGDEGLRVGSHLVQ